MIVSIVNHKNSKISLNRMAYFIKKQSMTQHSSTLSICFKRKDSTPQIYRYEQK